MEIYKTERTGLKTLENIEPGCWINLCRPDAAEIDRVHQECGIPRDFLQAALDEEESSRIEIEPEAVLVLIDVPMPDPEVPDSYMTMPLGIIYNEEVIITVCSMENAVIDPFVYSRQKVFSTRKKLRFLYQILDSAAAAYQLDLRLIDKSRQDLEKLAGQSVSREELINLYRMQSSLVYFQTSLRASEGVLERLERYTRIQRFPEDGDLLNDAIIENKQAIEMAGIYKDMISVTHQLLSDIADKELNTAMKILTSVTVVMAIPTIISGFYGMNVAAESMPLSMDPHGFGWICLITLVICLLCIWLLKRKKMF